MNLKPILSSGFILVLFLGSCDDQYYHEDLLDGSWHLKEQLADPGNGSGIYRPIDSQLYLKFLTNGTFVSTESVCGNGNTGGKYDGERIYPKGCDYSFRYEKIDGILYLYPPCIEPCGMKFEHVQ